MSADLTPALITFVFALSLGVALLLCMALLARSVRRRGVRVSEALVADRATVADTGAGGLIWTIRLLAITKGAAMFVFALQLSEAL